MFRVSRSIFKKFSIFPWTFCDYSLSSSLEPLSNSPCHSQKPPFLLHFNFNSSRKRYGFSLSHYIFHVLSFIFLSFWVVFSIWFLGVSIMGWVIFVEFECMGLVVYAFKMLHFSVIIIVFSVLNLFTDLYWLAILIPILICLIVICYLFGFSMLYSICEYGWFKMVELKWLGYIFLLFLIIDIIYVAFALRILSNLCWFEHLILIKICLTDICFFKAD